MKTRSKLSVIMSLLFLFSILSFQPITLQASEVSKKLLPLPDQKRAMFHVDDLPENEYITVKVRDNADRVVHEFDVKNEGQEWVLINFEALWTGRYSLDIILAENEILRKNIMVHHDAIVVRDVLTMEAESDFYDRWPLNML
ncbi:MAG: hypothetical protein JJU28_12350 [Cyclobacteriaceae bacterium]|nr:hypothetical protein [Cyclobacteriaceae bacterium]